MSDVAGNLEKQDLIEFRKDAKSRKGKYNRSQITLRLVKNFIVVVGAVAAMVAAGISGTEWFDISDKLKGDLSLWLPLVSGVCITLLGTLKIELNLVLNQMAYYMADKITIDMSAHDASAKEGREKIKAVLDMFLEAFGKSR